jgi:hypothetical protein
MMKVTERVVRTILSFVCDNCVAESFGEAWPERWISVSGGEGSVTHLAGRIVPQSEATIRHYCHECAKLMSLGMEERRGLHQKKETTNA